MKIYQPTWHLFDNEKVDGFFHYFFALFTKGGKNLTGHHIMKGDKRSSNFELVTKIFDYSTT